MLTAVHFPWRFSELPLMIAKYIHAWRVTTVTSIMSSTRHATGFNIRKTFKWKNNFRTRQLRDTVGNTSTISDSYCYSTTLSHSYTLPNLISPPVYFLSWLLLPFSSCYCHCYRFCTHGQPNPHQTSSPNMLKGRLVDEHYLCFLTLTYVHEFKISQLFSINFYYQLFLFLNYYSKLTVNKCGEIALACKKTVCKGVANFMTLAVIKIRN